MTGPEDLSTPRGYPAWERIADCRAEADATFVAHARADVSDLVAYAWHLESLLRECEEEMTPHMFGGNGENEWTNEGVYDLVKRLRAMLAGVPT